MLADVEKIFSRGRQNHPDFLTSTPGGPSHGPPLYILRDADPKVFSSSVALVPSRLSTWARESVSRLILRAPSEISIRQGYYGKFPKSHL